MDQVDDDFLHRVFKNVWTGWLPITAVSQPIQLFHSTINDRAALIIQIWSTFPLLKFLGINISSKFAPEKCSNILKNVLKNVLISFSEFFENLLYVFMNYNVFYYFFFRQGNMETAVSNLKMFLEVSERSGDVDSRREACRDLGALYNSMVRDGIAFKLFKFSNHSVLHCESLNSNVCKVRMQSRSWMYIPEDMMVQ